MFALWAKPWLGTIVVIIDMTLLIPQKLRLLPNSASWLRRDAKMQWYPDAMLIMISALSRLNIVGAMHSTWNDCVALDRDSKQNTSPSNRENWPETVTTCMTLDAKTTGNKASISSVVSSNFSKVKRSPSILAESSHVPPIKLLGCVNNLTD